MGVAGVARQGGRGWVARTADVCPKLTAERALGEHYKHTIASWKYK